MSKIELWNLNLYMQSICYQSKHYYTLISERIYDRLYQLAHQQQRINKQGV
ncbi:unnamed protein product [Paramecium octaurelia]|uniref:Uncharacterized protein n=1 Tax=Paramecium octaurelia TaxID=43137 RepID=A0A8S1VIU6_PAROT|nr:unnamed protein product [Paramecium octaurelia]